MDKGIVRQTKIIRTYYNYCYICAKKMGKYSKNLYGVYYSKDNSDI